MNRIIEWFANNGVAANILMILVVVGGLLSLTGLKQEVLPEVSADTISISVLYPGAAPEEVEDGIVLRVEESIQDLEDIKEITSTAGESSAKVFVELVQGADAQKLLNDIKSRVDAIDTFPEEAEEPIIEEILLRRQVINVAISGDADEKTLKRLGEQVRDDLSLIPGISQVELSATRPYEISIEVSEEALRRYQLTFDQVAQAIRRSSLDLPGGSIEARGGEILLRTEGQAYRGRQFEELPLLNLPDGTRLRVGDVAVVVDGFAETDQKARFDGQPGVLVRVFRVGDQAALELADKVKTYVAEARTRLPEGIQITTWQDDTVLLRSRLDLLLRNGRVGFVLVFLVLALFLRLSLAGWVALGIPISFLGTLILMPSLGVSVNLISLFAFIIVLGIVVDDAIVVGENIYRHHQLGKSGVTAAVDGAREVSVPVIFAILTTVAAFSPLLLVSGNSGKIMRAVPVIVICTLVFSLIESLLVLPNHLSHLHHGKKKTPGPLRGAWRRLRQAFARGLERFVDRAYRPSLRWALGWRYLVVALSLSLLMVVFGVVRAGWVKFTYFPKVEADNVAAMLTLPQGTPVSVTEAAIRRIESEALGLLREIEEETGEKVARHLMASIGTQPFRTAQSQSGGNIGSTFAAPHVGEVNVELVPAEERQVTSEELAHRLRERVGAVPDAVELTYSSSIFSTGAPIHVQLAGGDLPELRKVAAVLKEELRAYPGIQDIADSYRAGKEELELELTTEGELAGLTLADLARQVRQAFYGEEAQRIQRGRDEVKVMVRYPEAYRRSLSDLEEMRLRTPEGAEVPFATAARAHLSRGPASIERSRRQRVVSVTADVDANEGNANEILADLEARVLPEVLRDHPQVRYTFEGQQQDQRETLGGLARGFIFALLIIYALLAIPFKSYLQPVIVMSAIPFGFIGALAGHLILGLDLTILSMFGLVALTGVVVNDSLVMVDFINRRFRDGMPLGQAIREAGIDRFRPILLTSLTTFVGLLPLLLERSLQAQFLIPMATSLGFGVLFATFITLILVPVGYAILQDLKGIGARLMGRRGEDGELEGLSTSETPV